MAKVPARSSRNGTTPLFPQAIHPMPHPSHPNRKTVLYIGACLLIALAPGPDNCFVLAQSAGLGAAAGLWVTAGLVTGLCVHITLAVFGVAALLGRFPRVADGVAALGALYLLTVAWGMWDAPLGEAPTEQRTMVGFYLRGVALNLSNPKVILFFVAFLPRFLPHPCRHRSAHLFVLGALFAFCAFCVMAGFAVIGGTLSALLRARPEMALWAGRGAAMAVAAIALWILLPLIRRISPAIHGQSRA